jgi:hypothetical protein
MFRIFSRGRKPPLDHHHPRMSGVSSLHEAKLAAWAIILGEHRPSADPLLSRRHHRGMSHDMPAPEPAPRRLRPSPRAIVEAIGRAMGFGGQQPAEAAALSGILTAPVGETAPMTYIHGSDALESGRAPANAAAATIHSRVA